MNARAVLSGGVEFLTLADLFQILGGNGCSGTLRIISPWAPSPGEIFFHRGDPVEARCGSLEGTEAVYALFGWSEGRFEFFPQDVSTKRVITKSRMEIVLDALRKLDDGLIPKVGPVGSSGGQGRERGPFQRVDLPVIKGPLVDYTYIVGEETVSEGRRIVCEGAYGNWIWVILQGRVRITRETLYGPLPVMQLGDGAFIGTFDALLFGGHVRATTVTAVGDVHLALLDTHRLSAEFKSLSLAFRDLLLKMSGRLKGITDDLVALWTGIDFSGVSPGEQSFHDLLRTEAGHESVPTSMLIPEDLKEGLCMEAIQREYDSLSKTHKSLVHYITSSIYVTARMVRESWQSEGRSPLSCPHSCLGRDQERR